ncbi:amylo-alpha-1,6-glucosidase [Oleiharenicola lentus]|uniref:amylo-alpha-1,6-glucosidase n=1 Tax=Oleiharenicola lentus TaxID=2508720 RepID=UPI003F664C2B
MKPITRAAFSFFLVLVLSGAVTSRAQPSPAPQSLGAFELHAPRLRAEADAWARVAGVEKTDAERTLLARGRATILGNVVEVPAWAPRRGIEPASRVYRGIWNWDAAFHAVGVSHWDTALAREQIDIVLAHQLTNGMLPDVIHENGKVNNDYTKPPVMAWAVAVVDRRAPNDAWITRVYPQLVRLGEFWRKERGGERDGLYFYAGGHVGNESGWDNSVRWDGGYQLATSDAQRLWAIDLSCYLYAHYRALAYLAGRINSTDAHEWTKQADALAEQINARLWDDDLGFYIDRARASGKSSPVLSPAGFMPLFVKIASRARAERLAKVAADPAKFFPGMPTAAYDTPGYDSQKMWRGPAWLNTSFFALKGLRDYGHARPAEEMRTTLLNWVTAEPNLLREYYDSKTGEAIGARRFSWTGVFVIAFVLDWENDNLTWLFPEPVNEEKKSAP